MKVSEIFYSLQGEGRLAGVPSVFVRLSGCPLHCKWCDTPYARTHAESRDYTIDEAVAEIAGYNCSNVVITGGEPMHCPDLQEFTAKLASPNRHITIETAGIVFVPNLKCQLMSISPKLASSTPDDPEISAIHEKLRLNMPALRDLMACYEYQLKFVVDRSSDLDEIKAVLAQLPRAPASKVLLMPQARIKEDLLINAPLVAELCKATGFTFSHRMHVLLWNGQRGF